MVSLKKKKLRDMVYLEKERKSQKMKSRDLGWRIFMANILEKGPSISYRGLALK